MFELHFRPLLIYRYFAFAMVLILIWLMLQLWGQGDIRNSLILSVFLLFGIKYFQGALITKIDITDKAISLGRTFRNHLITVSDISKLAIRYVVSSKMDEFPETYKYLEVFTKSGKHYIYPISSGRRSQLREDEIKAITGLEYEKLPKLNPRITNRYLMFYFWV